MNLNMFSWNNNTDILYKEKIFIEIKGKSFEIFSIQY